MAHAELLVVALALSLVREFTPAPLIGTLAGLYLLTLLITRGTRRRIDWFAYVRPLLRDRLLVTLAAVAALGFAYSVAMGIWVPQVDDDVLTYHLVRAPLWWQHHGITYLVGILDFRNNAYPPGGELGPLATMTLAGNDYFVAVDQMLSALALGVGAAGIARRIGFNPRQALFSGLLVLTLPIIAIQVGTAMSDLVVGAFLVVAAFFLIDGSRTSPVLAGIATALAIDVKLSAPFAIPLLLVIAWLAHPRALRTKRLIAVTSGAALGAFWYLVNLKETGTLDGHVTEGYSVDRGPLAISAFASRLAINFIDMSGANGRDRWLYALAAGAVLAGSSIAFLRSRRRATLARGGVVALVTLAPLSLFAIEYELIRGYFKFWTALGRPDLANLDSGRDITIASSNFSWYGPLGSLLLLGAGALALVAVRRHSLDRLAIVCVAAPFYWLFAYSLLVFYQDWIGRYFAFAFVLAAATWGIVLKWRAVGWGIVLVAATSLVLSLANDAKRPSGLPLLERDKPKSVWRTPRWTGVALRKDYDAPIRYLDERIAPSADVALAITTSDPVYPFFGRGLDRHVHFVYAQDRDVPGVNWVFVRPDRKISLCNAWRSVRTTAYGWHILHRVPGRECPT